MKYDDGAWFAALAYTRSTTGADNNSLGDQRQCVRKVSDLRAALTYRFSANTRIGLMWRPHRRRP